MDSRAGRRLAPKPAAEDEARRVKDTAAGKRSNHGISSYGVELRRFVPEISERILYASMQNGICASPSEKRYRYQVQSR